MSDFIDISFWNGLFDWSKAVAQGVIGAYIKASEGLYIDKLFRTNSANCPLEYKGAYHFLCYEEGQSGAKQAEFFLDTMDDWDYNLPGALDIEKSAAYTATFDIPKVLDLGMDFVRRYRELAGHYPVIYASSYLTQYMWQFTSCPLWIANYTTGAAPLVYSWGSYALWQYSSTGDGQLYGNSQGNKNIDLNRVGKPVETWMIGGQEEGMTFSAQCTAYRLIIRSAPYISSETDTGARLLQGDVRDVLEVNGDWYRIQDGWVSALYMARITEPVEPEPEPEPLTLEERVTALEKAVFG